ncbi:MAG: TatD family hydrolase [Bacteroidales bacterium]
MKIIDIHTHNLSGDNEYMELKSFFHKSYIPESGFFSVGIHPWHAEKAKTNALIDELRPKAHQAFAIGECGLDKSSSCSFDKQREVFEAQIKISEDLKKPLIIHAVKTYPDIIAMHKKHKPAQAWIIHGFGGNMQTMKACTDHGIFLSYGALLMRGADTHEVVFKNTPDNLLFLETDESSISIRKIYKRAAYLKGIAFDDLVTQINQNFKTIQHNAY